MATAIDAVRLGELLGGAWRTFSRLGRAGFAASDARLSPARVRLLLALAGAPDSRMRDLAGQLDVSARAVTPLTDALEADGLVTRQADRTDRRAIRLRLTPAGVAEVRRIDELQAAISRQIFDCLTEEQRRQLAHLLETFIVSAGRTRNGPPC
jgi:DNA-binding MarR family transcriptional regulator